MLYSQRLPHHPSSGLLRTAALWSPSHVYRRSPRWPSREHPNVRHCQLRDADRKRTFQTRRLPPLRLETVTKHTAVLAGVNLTSGSLPEGGDESIASAPTSARTHIWRGPLLLLHLEVLLPHLLTPGTLSTLANSLIGAFHPLAISAGRNPMCRYACAPHTIT